jgi:circadian clock protein KaiC
METVRTYIHGLDDALGGGIPKGNVVLLSGPPGTRKTSIAYSIAHNNAKKGGKVIYFHLEEREAHLRRIMEGLGFKGVDEAHLYVVDLALLRQGLGEKEKGRNWLKVIEEMLRDSQRTGGYEIVVLDSLNILYGLESVDNPRADLFHFFQFLKDLEITSIIISEVPYGSTALCQYGEDFLADGIVYVRYFPVGETDVQLRLRIIKMRGIAHTEGYLALTFDRGAFAVTEIVSRLGGQPGIAELSQPIG